LTKASLAKTTILIAANAYLIKAKSSFREHRDWFVKSESLSICAICAIIVAMKLQTDCTEMSACLPGAAAILDDGRSDIDTRLAAFAQQQYQSGVRVRGLCMQRRTAASGCKADRVLVDIATGDTYLVSQPLGQGSSACNSDPQGFARASQVLRDALSQAPDLVICNRFGGLESEGGGFAAELLDIMANGIPLLTVVSPARVSAWQRFSGQAPVLAADGTAWQCWLDAALQLRRLSASR
jgi:hypothetical protein